MWGYAWVCSVCEVEGCCVGVSGVRYVRCGDVLRLHVVLGCTCFVRGMGVV